LEVGEVERGLEFDFAVVRVWGRVGVRVHVHFNYKDGMDRFNVACAVRLFVCLLVFGTLSITRTEGLADTLASGFQVIPAYLSTKVPERMRTLDDLVTMLPFSHYV
jgi:hypothetical protein